MFDKITKIIDMVIFLGVALLIAIAAGRYHSHVMRDYIDPQVSVSSSSQKLPKTPYHKKQFHNQKEEDKKKKDDLSRG